jgi:hypothetical protein
LRTCHLALRDRFERQTKSPSRLGDGTQDFSQDDGDLFVIEILHEIPVALPSSSQQARLLSDAPHAQGNGIEDPVLGLMGKDFVFEPGDGFRRRWAMATVGFRHT